MFLYQTTGDWGFNSRKWRSISKDFSLADHTLPTRPEPAWLKMAQSRLNGTTQSVDIKDKGWSPTMDRQWLKQKKSSTVCVCLCARAHFRVGASMCVYAHDAPVCARACFHVRVHAWRVWVMGPKIWSDGRTPDKMTQTRVTARLWSHQGSFLNCDHHTHLVGVTPILWLSYYHPNMAVTLFLITLRTMWCIVT